MSRIKSGYHSERGIIASAYGCAAPIASNRGRPLFMISIEQRDNIQDIISRYFKLRKHIFQYKHLTRISPHSRCIFPKRFHPKSLPVSCGKRDVLKSIERSDNNREKSGLTSDLPTQKQPVGLKSPSGWARQMFVLYSISGNRHRGSFGSCYNYGMNDSCDKSGMNCSSVPEEPAWRIAIC